MPLTALNRELKVGLSHQHGKRVKLEKYSLSPRHFVYGQSTGNEDIRSCE